MAKRLAVYTCTGCSIGEALDASKLEKIASKEYKVPVSRTHPYLCGADGLQMIRQDLAGDGALDGVVIAACSPRMKTETFAFDPSLVVERVNLREHVAWCQKPGDEDRRCGEDYLRMGISGGRRRAARTLWNGFRNSWW
jgi:quinone-modifying oxidoreductase subunit QmoB